MKKIYISGQISGRPLEEVRAKFQAAEDKLGEQGYEVVNPTKNGLPAAALREGPMALGILHLLKCDAIYMLAGWQFSRGATLEKNIAETTGKEVIYEIPPNRDFEYIKEAIYEGTGVTFAEITGESRDQKTVFARIIFAHLCRTQEGATVQRIAEEMNRSHATVIYYLRQFQQDILYTPSFRRRVEEVKDKLKDKLKDKDNELQ